MPLLEVKELKVYYTVRGGIFGRVVDYVKAVDDVRFSVATGETFGLTGEIGSGKSTVGKANLGLVPLAGGSIYFSGKNITKYIKKNCYEYRKSV